LNQTEIDILVYVYLKERGFLQRLAGFAGHLRRVPDLTILVRGYDERARKHVLLRLQSQRPGAAQIKRPYIPGLKTAYMVSWLLNPRLGLRRTSQLLKPLDL